MQTQKAPGGIRADTWQTYQSIEQIAAKVRRLLAPDIAVTQALPGLQLFETLHLLPLPTTMGTATVETAVGHLPTGVLASAECDARTGQLLITLAENTYTELERENPRARFSLAHEVGHAKLHCMEMRRSGIIAHQQLAALRRGEVLPHPKCYDTEWQANAFGAALLMPAEGLAVMEAAYEKEGATLGVLDIQRTYLVSGEAAYYRLKRFRERRTELLR